MTRVASSIEDLIHSVVWSKAPGSIKIMLKVAQVSPGIFGITIPLNDNSVSIYSCRSKHVWLNLFFGDILKNVFFFTIRWKSMVFNDFICRLTGSSFQNALEFGSLILYRLPLKLWPEALDGKIHHVHFHQVQHPEDFPVITQVIVYKSVTVLCVRLMFTKYGC